MIATSCIIRLDMISCPICEYVGATAQDVTVHINQKHFSSPQRPLATPSSCKRSRTEASEDSCLSPVQKCPVCGAGGGRVAFGGVSLQAHIGAHFEEESHLKAAGAPAISNAAVDADRGFEDEDGTLEKLVCFHKSCGAEGT